MHTSNTDHDETLKEQIEQALKKDFNNLLVKEFTTDWRIQRLKIGLDIEVMDFDNLMQLIKQDRERAVNAGRIEELEKLITLNKTLYGVEAEMTKRANNRLAQLSNLTQEKEE